MADVITGATQLDPVKQELISELVQRELKSAVTLLPTISDFSSLAVRGAKSVGVPKLGSFTVQERASTVEGDAQAIASATDDILFDKRAYVGWVIDSFDEIQANIPAQAVYARRSASAHGRYVDLKIIEEMEAGADAVTAGAISRDLILEMRKTLLKREANKNQLWLAISPDEEELMLKIDEFTRADIYGTSNIPDGMIGRVYGVNVMMNTQLAAGQFFMYDRDAVAIAFQQAPNMASEPDIKYGTNARRFAMDQLFGVKALQVAQAGATGAALVVKDGN